MCQQRIYDSFFQLPSLCSSGQSITASYPSVNTLSLPLSRSDAVRKPKWEHVHLQPRPLRV